MNGRQSGHARLRWHAMFAEPQGLELGSVDSVDLSRPEER